MFAKGNMLASIKARLLLETSEGEINWALSKNLENHDEKLNLIHREKNAHKFWIYGSINNQ